MSTRTIIITITTMRIDRLLTAITLSLTATVATSQDFSISLIKKTPEYLTFTVRNTSKSDLTVCLSDTWAISQHRVPDGGFSPFGMQSHARHSWGYVIGSDIADRFTASIPAGESGNYSIATPENGTYRVFIDYTRQTGIKTCEALYSPHPHRAKSAAFTVP